MPNFFSVSLCDLCASARYSSVLLPLHDRRDLRKRIEVIQVDFMRLQLELETLLEKCHQLECCNRIQYAARDQLHRIVQLGRVFARQKLVQNIFFYDLLDVFHVTPMTSLVLQGSGQTRSNVKPAARPLGNYSHSRSKNERARYS